MDTLRWLRKNGNIIGVEVGKIEFNLMAIAQNETLHQMYHEQLKRDNEDREKI